MHVPIDLPACMPACPSVRPPLHLSTSPPPRLPTSPPLPAVALLFLLLCWALLCLVHLRHMGELYDPKRAAAAIRTQYEQLGPPSYPEVAPPVGSGLLVVPRRSEAWPPGDGPAGCGVAPRTSRGAAEPCNLHEGPAAHTVSAHQRLECSHRPPPARHPRWRYTHMPRWRWVSTSYCSRCCGSRGTLRSSPAGAPPSRPAT